ncbi:hypothetical protein Srubr_65850 [Streptomyces rubradiris]|uniref:Uncharacterized protein n=1 Tax=Streptomyces rubradiris TaxID=285531 RepID=A0ABQ3RLP7_STRRR|nr:hypothetical protein Srubr_65850 [Streptomyces rubradiris]
MGREVAAPSTPDHGTRSPAQAGPRTVGPRKAEPGPGSGGSGQVGPSRGRGSVGPVGPGRVAGVACGFYGRAGSV